MRSNGATAMVRMFSTASERSTLERNLELAVSALSEWQFKSEPLCSGQHCLHPAHRKWGGRLVSPVWSFPAWQMKSYSLSAS